MKRITILILLFLPLFLYGQAMNMMHTSQKTRVVGGGSPPISNMVSNGSFDSATGWATGAAWAIDGGNADYTCCGASTLSQYEVDMITPMSASTDYTLSFDISTTGSGTWFRVNAVYDSGTGTEIIAVTAYTNGSYSLDFTTPGTITGGGISFYAGFEFESCSIDNIVLTTR